MNHGLPNGSQLPTSSNQSMQQQNYQHYQQQPQQHHHQQQQNGPTMYAQMYNGQQNNGGQMQQSQHQLEHAMNSMHLQNYQQQQLDQNNMGYGGGGGGYGAGPQWNLNAPVFVPRGSSGSYPTWQQQSMMNGGGGTGGGAMYDAYSTMPYDSSWLGEIDNARLEAQVHHSETVARELQGGPNQAMLMEVQVGIEQLIAQPEEAEVWTEAIISRLTHPRTANIDVLQVVNQMIFETAAAQPQSSYILAVLLNSMCAHVQLAESYLMHAMLPYCRQEHERRHELYGMDGERLRAFAQFVAELFLRVHTRQQNARISILMKAVYEQVVTLLSNCADDTNVCAAARIVKTVGRAMCEDNPDELDELINDRLRPLAQQPPKELSEATRKQLTSVLTLHENKWGLARSVHNSTATEPTSPVMKSSANTTGVTTEADLELSIEERQFLEAHLPAIVGVCSSTENGEDDNAKLSEEDEEAKAYDEFLKQQQQQKR